jgi:hypothetical protein
MLCCSGMAMSCFAQTPLPSYAVQLVHDSPDITDKKLRNWGSIKKSYPDSMLVVQALGNLALELQLRGYPAANIDSAVWKGDTCTAFVHVGRQLVFSRN